MVEEKLTYITIENKRRDHSEHRGIVGETKKSTLTTAKRKIDSLLEILPE